jgi:NhaA family Na+:H+ antiporter
MTTPPRSRGTAKVRAAHSAVVRRVQLPLQDYLHTEGLGGAVLIAAAFVGIAWANSPWSAHYDALWHLPVRVAIGNWLFDHDVRHVINDGLMAIFFFVVGLEIKREFVEGSLSDRRRAMLPVLAAAGGMVVPAALYAAVVGGGPSLAGWGIPMATDIAFAMAVLALTRAPHDVKVLLLALAVVDDIGAILVIAIFYSSGFSAGAGLVALICLAIVLAMQRVGFTHMGFYVPVAGVFWYAVLASGVHATIAGVILGALTPAHALVPHPAFARLLRQLDERLSVADRPADTDEVAGEVEELARQTESPLRRAERIFHPWSSYAILPVFAFANSGVALSADAWREALDSPVAAGIVLGLFVGKPVGIFIFSWAAVRSGLAKLPDGLGWTELAAVGVLAGIGFTVSLFITDLAFDDDELVTAAKIGIFVASLLAAAAGWMAMRHASPGRAVRSASPETGA